MLIKSVMTILFFLQITLFAESATYLFLPNSSNFSIAISNNSYQIIGTASSAERSFNNAIKQATTGERISIIGLDPAGKAVAEKIDTLIQEISQRSVNARDWNSYLHYLDGIVSQISDTVRRIHLLGVKASNGIMGELEREIIQSEIDILISSITSTTNYATFNKKKIELPVNPEALGLTGIDVVNNPAATVGIADEALAKLNIIRSRKGAQSRMLEMRIKGNSLRFIHMTSSYSVISDTDMVEVSTTLNLSKVRLQNAHGVLYRITRL
ncbi:MAG TPA: hypothetical protein P5123_05570 [Spirochaetota bacterium]|nr:hypothetical protein [Spirochaetota bacterium]